VPREVQSGEWRVQSNNKPRGQVSRALAHSPLCTPHSALLRPT
jgi:hypothetical protein